MLPSLCKLTSFSPPFASSILEEAVFRGLILHGLITKIRLGPLTAATLSSALFGASHIANERNVLQRAVYAAWTFFGGLIFGAAYLNTGGGLILPVTLHFFNNAIVAAVCVSKVALKLSRDRDEFRDIAERVGREQMSPERRYPFVLMDDTGGQFMPS